MCQNAHEVHSEHIDDNRRAKQVVDGLQGFLLQIDLGQIIVREADKPNTVEDFLKAE